MSKVNLQHTYYTKVTMKKCYFFLLSCFTAFSVQAQTGLQATFLSRYTANEYNLDGGVMEISAYDAASKRLFSINGSTSKY